jgi:amidohydrolase
MASRYASLLAEARAFEGELLTLRRTLHQEPEIGFQEFKTAARLREACERGGLVPSDAVAVTGFYVDVGPATDGFLAYRADIDGLPITDLKTTAYRSTCPGFGHLCGHDAHSTIATGVARLLKGREQELKRRVRVFFQPAEETSPSGAPEIMNAGVLDGAELILGIHCDPTLPAGSFGLKAGADTASFDGFDITVHAPYALHSARPHTGPDAMWIALKLASELYALPTRITDSQVASVIAVGTFHGGQAINAIPESVRFTGTIRTSGEEARRILNDHVARLIDGYQQIYGVKIERIRHEGSPPVVNDEALTARVGAHIRSVFGSDKLVPRSQSMGAEDFGHYTARMPGAFVRVGTRAGEATGHELHSNYFDMDESVLAPTCALFADTLIALANGEI